MKKDGFYSRQFRQSEANDLQALDEPGLQDEIAMLRVAIRRTMEAAEGVDDLKELVQTLRALAQAAGRLAELLRTQDRLRASETDLDALLTQAVDEINQELGIE